MHKNKNQSKKYLSLFTVFTFLLTLVLPLAPTSEVYAESGKGEPANVATNGTEEVSSTKALNEGEFLLPIMHMNDTHANVENYPYLTTLIKDYRETNPESLLLHGGDVFAGTLYFNTFKGQADLELLNLMDIDAMVFGNHEFDLGDSEDGHKALAEFVDKANFPMLGANSDFTEDPDLGKFEPKKSVVENAESGDAYNSIIVEKGGEKIGIFGLTTEDTKDIASPVKVTFSNYIETAKEEVEKLEEAGIDKIIAVTHIGFDSSPSVGNDLLLAEAVDGIDVIVGGHSHTEVEPPTLVEKDGKAPTVIVQAGEYAENLGTIEVTFDENGEVVDHSGRLTPIEVDREMVYEPDAESVEALAPYKEEVDKVSKQETGAIAQKELTNPRADKVGDSSVRANETELGNLVTDAMLAKSKEKDADIVIAMQNGGGIRTSIDKGPITNGEVINVLPFGNNPVIVELTGKEIKEILEHAVKEAPAENGGFLHISGMKYYYDSTKDVGNRVVEMLVVDEDGTETEIDPEGNLTYKITTNGFTGQGGDGFDTFAKAFKDGRVRDLGESDWEQLAEYMVEDLGRIVDPEIEGRIIDLKGEALPGETEDKTGWVKEGNTWYYYDDKGSMETGWKKIKGTFYYMDDSGAMQTGWEKVKGTWYYMNDSGAMQTGWNKVEGTWYYLDSNGHMKTGWNKLKGSWYYMDSRGAMQTGWEKIKGTWYYMNDSGAMGTGWTEVGNTWYYMNSHGHMETGWQKITGSWYYMNSRGAMQTDWAKVGNTWYYMHSSGRMQTGWHEIDGSWFYMSGNGAMETGWTKVGDTWYYMHSSGRMQTGRHKIKGKWYYMDGTGAMQE